MQNQHSEILIFECVDCNKERYIGISSPDDVNFVYEKVRTPLCPNCYKKRHANKMDIPKYDLGSMIFDRVKEDRGEKNIYKSFFEIWRIGNTMSQSKAYRWFRRHEKRMRKKVRRYNAARKIVSSKSTE